MSGAPDEPKDPHPRPATASGDAWQRAEQFNRRLADTRDTPRSFLLKGTIGCAVLTVVALIAIWLLISFIRWLIA